MNQHIVKPIYIILGMVRADDSDMILMLIYFLILDLIFELMNCVKVKITESFGQFWLNLLQRRFTHKYMITVSLDSLLVTYITMICNEINHFNAFGKSPSTQTIGCVRMGC